MANSSLTVGLEVVQPIKDLGDACDEASGKNFNFLMVNLVQGTEESKFRTFKQSELLVNTPEYSSSIVGRTSAWINMDHASAQHRKASEEEFRKELSWAAHLAMTAVSIDLPAHNSLINAAHVLLEASLGLAYTQIWVRVPVRAATETAPDTWETWNRLRALVRTHGNIVAALQLEGDLPDFDLVRRWVAEPVKCMILPTSIFLTNKGGFPVLSKAHQAVVNMLLKLRVQVVIQTNDLSTDTTPYMQYVVHLNEKLPMNEIELFARGYEDVLQAPLQPLRDNLESHTYETFEQDPIKYQQYEEAVRRALLDKPEDSLTVLMVLGSGRGPLVQRSLIAAEDAKRKVRVYAIEKNPNAVLTLEHRKATEWGDKVTVVSTDMRVWEAPEKADIIVSELLGSWGDNELSPECLDGAQRFMKPTCISIPSAYTSFVTPVACWKLFTELTNSHEAKNMETPFVVQLVSAAPIAPVQPVFTFVHPNPDPVIDNTRFLTLEFTAKHAAVLHGFAGYFEATLYKDVMISINPATHSPGMFSWFPLFIPLKQSVAVKPGDKIVAHFWRLADKFKVWYEWTISEPRPLEVHNPNGQSYWIGL